MITSRQKILTHLKKTRSATAREIARAMKMSAPNVRHHLSVLCSDGRVEVSAFKDQAGRGRPEKLYSLSQAALGDNLAILVEALLGDKIEAEKIGERIATLQGLAEIAASGPMPRRLTLLVEKLSGMNYQARWEAGAEGPRLIFGRCPYAKVIAGHPELCAMDASMLESALARTIQPVQKKETAVRGSCPFIFRTS